jgi:endonuclease/exonuclease/phosphatase family metal-dependent hydrolase
VTFSILFWNIWFYNQIEGKARADRLLGELKRFVDEYQPDFIALNEVVQSSDDGSVMVIEYLRELGYTFSHRPKLARFNDYWLSGAVLCSRHKISQAQNIVISKHGFAAKRGYPGYNKEAISAHVTLPGGHDLKIIVAHPLATVDALNDHRAAMAKLNQLVHSKDYANDTILVGDMNEWRLIPGAFRAKAADVMHSRTGTVLNPTWRHNAHRFTLLRLNLDYLYWSKHSDFALKDFKVLSSRVSDHRPLFATFEYE